ncbi:CGNR zinc finger domain-containing protein [Planococcus halocryophilus]|uniref:CGNR zinc finger domain-containing protein n=1 Tax=Planococcus halocryophilus TaxID=1215089 RepID=UPI001F0DD3F8|nr:CGNR zinc finger domain-containing protein [Planococcus halocryophilus]MCH4826385.1 CGNR zinc finger domain-containing protein [Planococcus halocryophilus]
MENNSETGYSFVSQYLFINFLNTINIKKVSVTDFLDEENGLGDWLSFMTQQGILNQQQAEKLHKSPIDVKRVKEFRDQWRGYLSVPEGNEIPFASLATYTEEAPLFIDKTFTSVPSKGGTEGFLALLSFEMIQAFQQGVFKKIKRCESSLCYAFFVDTSGRRKWCSMEVCGNREKARKHYAKKGNI